MKIIEEQIAKHCVVLYMKGTPFAPLCGFSAAVVEILKRCGVTHYCSVDVLADEGIRQNIKVFSQWPTIPQLYIKGEFIGGADIVQEMYTSGELIQSLETAGAICQK